MPKMRRLTTYLAGSTALAVGVVTWAFFKRPNFYSAAVYLSQSNACLMILANVALICGAAFMYALEQLLFGPLRPIEIEQLYERGWFAITEWLFAMSTFRDEFGVWFLVMFSLLFVGKVWGWIAEGRIESLEQQPPANPRLFHSRLIASLGLFVLFTAYMSKYCFETVMYQARPGVMVMFVFEFAIINVSAISTCIRYALWWYEQEITQAQIRDKIAEQKAAIRTRREQALAEGDAEAVEAAGREEDVSEEDVEVPGWEAKGGWMFTLDIGTDLLKLIAYMAFFTVLTVFYGIPIYIIRDLYMTLRSFTKRVTDYLKYQRATTDMNQRYPDATAEQLSSDNTCIVCREEMRPWQQPGEQGAAPAATIPERNRPKKLPCGHILHFGCLRSWLERQQVCPICRRSVLQTRPVDPQANAENFVNALFGAPANRGQHNPGAQNPPAGPAVGAVPGAAPLNGMRQFQLGPLRLQFGYGQGPAGVRNMMQQLQQRQQVAQGGAPQLTTTQALQQVAQLQAAAQAAAPTASSTSTDPAVQSLRQGLNSALAMMQLDEHEAYLQREFALLNATMQRVNYTRQLFAELQRIRSVQDAIRHAQDSTTGYPAFTLGVPQADGLNGFGLPNGYQVIPLMTTYNGVTTGGVTTAPVEGAQAIPGLPSQPSVQVQQQQPASDSSSNSLSVQDAPVAAVDSQRQLQLQQQQSAVNAGLNAIAASMHEHQPATPGPNNGISTAAAPPEREPAMEAATRDSSSSTDRPADIVAAAAPKSNTAFGATGGWSFPAEAEAGPSGSMAHTDEHTSVSHQPTVEDIDE